MLLLHWQSVLGAGGDLSRHRYLHDAVNAKQELVGGVILRPQLSLSALVQNTAQLPQIDLAAKAPASILGKSTSSCLQNGFVAGHRQSAGRLAERFCAELGPQTAFYATGNLPIPIREHAAPPFYTGRPSSQTGCTASG